ncbi:ATP-binding protein [Chroococcidiopsis sp. SAG 2025]|uniref:ATP-binding protein n=1 Tax=Chroococcidiopsis sp. SAG 2025 TaxID=171389 RepID=UPI002936F685|nr:ATP-binding protein [Chroococcidiopsis sp. SAG 2025]
MFDGVLQNTIIYYASFTDSTMTVAAVDRLVHHAVILEILAPSFRQQAALQRSSSTDQKQPK